MSKFNECFVTHLKDIYSFADKEEKKLFDEFIKRSEKAKSEKEAKQAASEFASVLKENLKEQRKFLTETTAALGNLVHNIESRTDLAGMTFGEAFNDMSLGGYKRSKSTNNSIASKVNNASLESLNRLHSKLLNISPVAYDLLTGRSLKAVKNKILNGGKELPERVNFANNIRRELSNLNTKGVEGEIKISKTGDTAAFEFARELKQTLDISRQRAIKAGAVIADLDQWSGKQSHWAVKYGKAKFDPWFEFVQQNIDFSKYNVGTGNEKRLMDSGELKELFLGMYRNIQDGEYDSFRFQDRSLARKTLEKERVIHFKDVEAEIKYNELFNRNENILDQINNIVENNHRQGAVMESFGPDPYLTLTELTKHFNTSGKDLGFKIEGRDITEIGDRLFRKHLDNGVALQSILAPTNRFSKNNRIGNAGTALRSWDYLVNMGGYITGLTNEKFVNRYNLALNLGNVSTGPAGIVSAGMDQLNFVVKGFSSLGKKQEVLKSLLQMEGNINYLKNSSNTRLGIHGGGNVGLIDSVKQIFNITNMIEHFNMVNEEMVLKTVSTKLGEFKDVSWGNLDKITKRTMESYDIDERVFNLFRESISNKDKSFNISNLRKIGSISVQDRDLIANMYHGISDHSLNTISQRTRIASTFGTKTNTGTGEFVRTAMQYQTYTMQLFNNYVMTLIHNPDISAMGKVGQMGSYIAVMMGLFYIQKGIRDIKAGNTPRGPWIEKDGKQTLNTELLLEGMSWIGVTGLAGNPIAAFLTQDENPMKAKNKFAKSGLRALLGARGGALYDLGEEAAVAGRAVATWNYDRGNTDRLLKATKRSIPFQNALFIDAAVSFGLDLMLSSESLERKKRYMEELNGNKPLFR